MSARTDELFSKEYGEEERTQIALFLELQTENTMADIRQIDAFREIGAACSAGLLQADIPHTVYWYDGRQQMVVRQPIHQEEHHFLMSAELVRTAPVTGTTREMSETIRYMMRCGSLEQTVLSLDLSLRLYENGHLLKHFSMEKYRQEIQTLPEFFSTY